jgi:ABC-2 type transport system permease protein
MSAAAASAAERGGNAVSHTWTLTAMRMRLAVRNRAFFFFSFVMPLLFLLGAVLFFGRGKTEWMGYILGAILTVTVMGSFWGLSVQLVTFREQGILRRFRLAPLGAGSMLASSILSNYFMALPIVILEILVCRLAFHMQSWGNLWAIFILVTIGSATFSALGLIVASVTNTMQETQMINNLIWMGFLFLSGATIPLAAFPGWLQRVALFIPAQYLATGLESAGARMATGYQVLEDSAALALGLVVAFEVSRQLFRWEPEAKVPRKAKLWVLAALVPFLLFGTWESATGRQLHHINQNFQELSRRLAPSQTTEPR